MSINCYISENRKYILVNTPKYLFDQDIETQGFFLSSDISNTYGYKAYFPFYGVDETGWVIKGRSCGEGIIFCEASEWRKGVCDLLSEFDDNLKYLNNEKYITYNIPGGASRTANLEVTEYCQLFMNLLDKFTDWWEVRISATIGGETWDRSDFTYLKDLALNYRWVAPVRDIVEYRDIGRRSAKLRRIIKPGYFTYDKTPIINISKDCLEGNRDELNEWLKTMKASEERLENIIDVPRRPGIFEDLRIVKLTRM
jgi:hypothetical protein